MDRYDLVVVGAGPGGYVAAEHAAELGKKVLLIEKENLGGVCTNRGCIPTKSLLNSAKQYVHTLDCGKFGVHCNDVSFCLEEAMAWKNETVETLRSGIQFMRKTKKVDVVFGEAVFVDNHHVKVGDAAYETQYLVLATGSSPFIPPIEGATLPNVVTSDGVLGLERLPESIAIIGGGVIGIEFASFFSMVGVKVSVIEMMPEILPMMDGEFSKLMRREMKAVSFNLGCKVTAIKENGVQFIAAKGEEKFIESELVLMSVGRRANIAGLEPLNLNVDRGAVVVDDHMRTNVDSVYAVGDINGRSQLAHSASRMAQVAVDDMFGAGKASMNYDAIPWAVYGMPEASGCGLTQDGALKAGVEVKCATVQMRSNGRFLAENGKRASGLVKVVVDAMNGRILGLHMIGPYSSEMIWGAAALIEVGMTVDEVKDVVFPHPSVSELIKDACFALK